LRDFLAGGIAALQAGKPRTRAFLAYLDDGATTLTIVQVFGYAESMATHIEGADERSTAASEFIETTAIDIYGTPTEPILAACGRSPAQASPSRSDQTTLVASSADRHRPRAGVRSSWPALMLQRWRWRARSDLHAPVGELSGIVVPGLAPLFLRVWREPGDMVLIPSAYRSPSQRREKEAQECRKI